MSAIIKALKEKTARVSCGNRWLTWDEVALEWVVRSREYGQRKNRIPYRGESEEQAVHFLTYCDED